jgi:MtrB/PioB family decaheme-associated outer membrane protein
MTLRRITMRNRILCLAGALLLMSTGHAWAQQTAPAPTTPALGTPRLGVIDFGVRADSLTGDAARYNRFRDLREGLYMSRFLMQKETDTWVFRGQANNVGYRDQQFLVNVETIGKLKADFEWNQTPLFISDHTRSLFVDRGNGVLDIDDAIQQGIQAGTLTLANALGQAKAFDLRSRRDVGRFDLVYQLNRDVDLKFMAKSTHRKGYNLMSFGLGTSPGLNPSQEMGVPTDDRTNDFSGSAEFANAKGRVSVGYNGSWYDNAIPTLTFDNPLRYDNINNGAAQGRVPLWPSNTAFAVNAGGSYKLAPRTRASASLSIGRWTQDERLVPATVNTALVQPALPRSTANTQADIRTALFTFTSRPISSVAISAKYRYYDYDNRAEHYRVENAVIGDWGAGTQIHETEPASFKRKTADIDLSYSAYGHLSFGVGASREEGDRTFRIFEQTTDDSYRFTIDSVGNRYVTMRAKFEHSRRTGSGFEAHLLEEVGEQPDTRHFDVANRKRTRGTVILSVTPVAWLALNGSVANGTDDYFATGFGLRDNENKTYSLGFDLLPADTVSLGFTYGREKYTATQYSRTANPAPSAQFGDPTRDWWVDQDDTVKTVTASLDLIKTIRKTDIRLSYDLSDGKAAYVYNQPANQTVFTTVALAQLPQLKNTLTGGRADVQYFVRANLALGVAYWYEEYSVDDFALDGQIVDKLNPANASNGNFANTIYSGYLWRPYKVHTGWLKLSYLW